jgi:tripartite-type tricarboxylate transporter receptor subunit TctC
LLDCAGIALSHLGRMTFHGGAAILQAVIDGRTDFAAQYVGEMRDLLRSGTLRVLAVSGDRRTAAWPGVPTALECGFEGFDLLGWTSIVGPPGLHAGIIDRWVASAHDLAQDPAFVSEIEAMGSTVAWLDAAGFHEALKHEHEVALATAMRLGLRR